MVRLLRPFTLIAILLIANSWAGAESWSVSDASVSVPLRPPSSPEEVAEPVVIRLYFRDRQHLNAVAWKLDIWESDPQGGYVVAAVTAEQYKWLSDLGYRLEIDTAKTGRLSVMAPLDPRFYYFDDYFTNPSERYVVDFLQTIASAYPSLVELVDIGDAWLAGQTGEHDRDIWVLRITNEDPTYGPIEDKPALFLFATIHAREVVVPELAIRYIKYLTAGYDGDGGYGTDPDVTWLVNHNVAYVLVMQNPDAHWVNEQNTSAYHRKNMDNDDGCSNPSTWGVDLNRNHSFLWACCSGSSANPCDETYRGPSAGSEPETQAFQNYFGTVMKDQNGPNDDSTIAPASPITTTGIFISLHSHSDLVLWPWGFNGYGNPPNYDQLRTIGRKFAYYNDYDPSGTISYDVDGATDDWTYGKFGIASFTFEVGPGSGTCAGFFPPYDCIDGYSGRSFWAENKPAFLYAHKIARTPYLTSYGPDTVGVTVASDSVHQGTPVTLTATVADQRYAGDPLVPIAAAEYFIDGPDQDGAGIPMDVVDGSWGAFSEEVVALIDTSALAQGQHYILVHGQNADGDWGPFSSAFLEVAAEPDSAITGVVRDGTSGMPIDQADVRLYGGPFDQSATTGPDGAFAFNVFSDTYALDASAYGYYASALVNITATTGVTTTQDISLTAIPEGAVAGWVRESGTNLPLVATVSAISDYTSIQTATDPDTGLFSLPAFSGTYTVTASAVGHLPMHANVAVRPGLTTTQNFSLASQACVLLVDDDGGRLHETAFQDALEYAGFLHQTWDIASQGSPPLEALTPYQALLWFTADNHNSGYRFHTLSANALASLSAYLDGGGNLLMTGHNVNAGNYYTPLFQDKLAVSFVGDLSVDVELPVVGRDRFAGLEGILSSATYSETAGFTPDLIEPRLGATSVFTYPDAAGAGVAHDAGSYRTINLGFGLEGLSDAALHTEVISRGLAWLSCPPLTVGLRLVKETDQNPVPVGAPLTYALSLTNNTAIAATDVVVSDTLPTGLIFLKASHAGAPVNHGTVVWQIARMEPYEQVTLTLTTLVGDVVEGTSIVNTDYNASAAQPYDVWTGDPVTTTVQGLAAPQASFYTNSPMLSGQTVVFTNTTIGFRAITYTWDFGDRSQPVVHSNFQPTLTHVFQRPGWYTVTLTAVNSAGPGIFRAPVEILQAQVGKDWIVYLPIILENH